MPAAVGRKTISGLRGSLRDQKKGRRIEDCLDREGELDLKELKTVTGALKELQSLWEEKNGTKGGGLTVRFEGEAEEMSL